MRRRSLRVACERAQARRVTRPALFPPQILAKLPPFAGRLSLHHDRRCAGVGDVFGTEPCRALCEDVANLIEATIPYDHPERASHAIWGRDRACNAVRGDKY